MRLIIIPTDKFVSIDAEGIHGVDMTWIPEFIGESGISTQVHAVQWYDDHGEIELESRDNNIVITELGVFAEAIPKYEERKKEIRLEEIRIEQEILEQEQEILEKEQKKLEQKQERLEQEQERLEQSLVGIQTNI